MMLRGLNVAISWRPALPDTTSCFTCVRFDTNHDISDDVLPIYSAFLLPISAFVHDKLSLTFL
jgi:hypothetical protein